MGDIFDVFSPCCAVVCALLDVLSPCCAVACALLKRNKNSSDLISSAFLMKRSIGPGLSIFKAVSCVLLSINLDRPQDFANSFIVYC